MIEVYPNVFLIEIQLKNNPLKALNCFIIRSNEQSMIIDTGFNTEETQH